MKQATPCKTLARVMLALDNGGRFFNLLTRAGDGEISQSEISKAAWISGGGRSVPHFSSSQSLEAYLLRIKPRSLIS
ncbi:MAG: hypothetical protein P8J66_07020 [Verrucomicrobiota bacterium]|nr:hypothetical protein [Verrucomicrobiota bacterium]